MIVVIIADACVVASQVPLMFITNWVYRKSRNESIGNLTFWFSFCIFGQPWALLKFVLSIPE